MDKQQARRTAIAAGLHRLEEKHLEQLARSSQSARELSGNLPKDLHWSEESAVQFRLALPRIPRVEPGKP